MSKINKSYLGCVNPPIYQASTVLFESLDEMKEVDNQYGRAGTETNFALEREVAELENGYKTIATPSGLAAIVSSILAFVRKGDHILVCDTVYGPTKLFCDKQLRRFGVEVSYYDATIGKEIESLVQDNTQLIFLESPSSLLYEIQEIEEIVEVAKKRNLRTVIDSTWGAGYLFKALDFGIDVSVQSGSKYFSGHSDILFGTITAKVKEIYDVIWAEYYLLGYHTSPQDCYLAVRGLKTLDVRLEKHQKSAIEIAEFLESKDEIAQVIYPGLPSFKQHDRYKKYFSGANGLISFVFKSEYSIEQIRNFVDSLQLFKLGYSWGGFESLAMIYENLPGSYKKKVDMPLIRFHVGIENLDELKQDIDNALTEI